MAYLQSHPKAAGQAIWPEGLGRWGMTLDAAKGSCGHQWIGLRLRREVGCRAVFTPASARE